MNPTVKVNQRVDIVTQFHRKGDYQTLCFPSLMKYNGQLIKFSELGLRHETSQGNRAIHVFDMTDGQTDYRLEFDAQALTWTLIEVIECQR